MRSLQINLSLKRRISIWLENFVSIQLKTFFNNLVPSVYFHYKRKAKKRLKLFWGRGCIFLAMCIMVIDCSCHCMKSGRIRSFWSVFSRIRTEYGEILRIFPYSIRMRENTDQNNSEYGHFLRSLCLSII